MHRLRKLKLKTAVALSLPQKSTQGYLTRIYSINSYHSFTYFYQRSYPPSQPITYVRPHYTIEGARKPKHVLKNVCVHERGVREILLLRACVYVEGGGRPNHQQNRKLEYVVRARRFAANRWERENTYAHVSTAMGTSGNNRGGLSEVELPGVYACGGIPRKQ
ncbi:hypothetical protein NEOLEDRAFT_980298 [Neolentinus lepideus HHB14362 ss-1]|uniref:Uncharacterized protein n=1 Tax=Neolentinus lepideus HHB14362 ss-1 TaxID=1314782 RepID=A0A165N995_9AGAM|nr:hypothetical protein NEOLEDRAFT_980298 [Neolentinus lepideus HHB14362 ss-1]